MAKLIFALVVLLLAILWFMSMSDCRTVNETYVPPKKQVDPPMVLVIHNHRDLSPVFGKGEPTECGLNEKDFKEYVKRRVEKLQYTKVVYENRQYFDSIECIGLAMVFLK